MTTPISFSCEILLLHSYKCQMLCYLSHLCLQRLCYWVIFSVFSQFASTICYLKPKTQYLLTVTLTDWKVCDYDFFFFFLCLTLPKLSATDYNECEDDPENGCTHFCHNWIGGYHCSCRHGYYLDADKHTCTGTLWVTLTVRWDRIKCDK